jgi:hypothetical protein
VAMLATSSMDGEKCTNDARLSDFCRIFVSFFFPLSIFT